MARIKICGLSRAEDVEYANICMPDYVGFVFAPSKRRVSAEQAGALRRLLAPGIASVGVFVNEDIREVARICEAGTIDMIQLHGDEGAGYIRSLRGMVGAPVIKAVPVGEELALPDADPDYFMFDALSADVRGGGGRAFRWDALKGHPGDYFLAGGIDNGNVEAAVRMLDPFCVDVSSGVETDGRKDLDKMSDIVRRVRGVR
ncbi:MAG: phosphoribosylanthranilate isomerase [Methanomassiliicoccaceae archaeon]|nr:phosphoribosylanthranilate isomerase [Methanomassiliicoccaceae archaeon]